MSKLKHDEYVDLGLPSRTMWKSANEEDFYEFDEAVRKYGNNLPTLEQFKELIYQCEWEWIEDDLGGYMVTGPNGNSIVLPCAGCRIDDSVEFVGSDGHYWSSTLFDYGDSDFAMSFDFDSDVLSTGDESCLNEFSVRLVQNTLK